MAEEISLRDRLKRVGESLDVARAPDIDVSSIKDRLMRVDNAFDSSGVKDFKIRFGLAAMDTPDEQENFLKMKVGESGYTRDKYGRIALTPEGLDSLNIKHEGKPVLIDEPGLSKQDLVDLLPDSPAILGGVIGGTLGSPGGPVISAQLAGLGAVAGRAVSETIEDKMGLNLEEQGDVTRRAAGEFPLSVGGELVAKGFGVAGRKLLAPEAKRMTPKAARLAKEASDIGAQPKATQLTRAPIMGRVQSMMDTIFGDPLAVKNSKALNKEILRLKSSTFPHAVKKGTIGDLIKSDIRAARKALSTWAKDVYGNIDKTFVDDAGKPLELINTQKLKQAASDLLDELPKSADGSPILADTKLLSSLNDIDSLGDSISFQHMQRIRGRLFAAIGDDTIVPGISSRDARQLYKAAKDSFDDVILDDARSREFRTIVKEVEKKYAYEIKKFDNAFIRRAIKDPKFAGALDPEQIVSATFRKGRHTNITRLFRILPDETKDKVRRLALEDLLMNISGRADDVLDEIFTGKKFLQALDGYGRDTLEAMFGADKVNELYRLGEVTQLVTQKMKMSGGLVAAHVALHPLQNLGKLVQLNIVSRIMNTKNGLKWLTEGLALPNTRRGAMALTRLTAQAQMLSKEVPPRKEEQ